MSLAFTTIYLILPPFLSTMLATDLSADSSVVRTMILSGISLALAGGIGLFGLMGLWILETNRVRTSMGRRRWDKPRLAAVASVLAGALLFLPGLIAGFFHVPGALWLIAGFQIAGGTALFLSAGAYLFLTARSMDPASTRIRRVALGLGLIAGGLASALSLALQARVSIGDFTLATMYNLAIATLAIGSLLAWIVVFAGILGRFRAPLGPAIVPGEA